MADHRFGQECAGWPLCSMSTDALVDAGEEYALYLADHEDDGLASALGLIGDELVARGAI